MGLRVLMGLFRPDTQRCGRVVAWSLRGWLGGLFVEGRVFEDVLVVLAFFEVDHRGSLG